MTPQAREILRTIAARYGVEPGELIAHCKPRQLLAARIEVAKALHERGYSAPRIGKVLDRNHTSILYLLGRIVKRQPRLKPPKPPKPGRRRQAGERRLIRYAGWDPTEGAR